MNVPNKVLKIINEQFNFHEIEVKPESRFVADLCFDSLDSVEFVMELEDEFAVLVDDEEMEKCITVSDAIRLVERLLEAA